MRGIQPISNLYQKIFYGLSTVWVEFHNVVRYLSNNFAVFIGQESGQYTNNGRILDLQKRTSCFFIYSEVEGRWFQVHHHGAIDDAELLNNYQETVKKR